MSVCSLCFVPFSKVNPGVMMSVRFRLTMTLLHNGNIHGLLIRQQQPLPELFSGANVESTGSFQFAVLKICLGGSLFHYFCAILFTW